MDKPILNDSSNLQYCIVCTREVLHYISKLKMATLVRPKGNYCKYLYILKLWGLSFPDIIRKTILRCFTWNENMQIEFNFFKVGLNPGSALTYLFHSYLMFSLWSARFGKVCCRLLFFSFEQNYSFTLRSYLKEVCYCGRFSPTGIYDFVSCTVQLNVPQAKEGKGKGYANVKN